MLSFLDTVLTMEGDAQQLFTALNDVGVRHAVYGVKAHFVPLFGEAFLLGMKELSGKDATAFTMAQEDAWEQVFKIIDSRVIKGMAAGTS